MLKACGFSSFFFSAVSFLPSHGSRTCVLELDSGVAMGELKSRARAWILQRFYEVLERKT